MNDYLKYDEARRKGVLSGETKNENEWPYWMFWILIISIIVLATLAETITQSYNI